MVWLFRRFIRAYQILVSPFLKWMGGPGNGCRFQPTCSQYCLEAVETHGIYGVWLGLKRLARCHPWGSSGPDPVPPRASDQARVAPVACE